MCKTLFAKFWLMYYDELKISIWLTLIFLRFIVKWIFSVFYILEGLDNTIYDLQKNQSKNVLTSRNWLKYIIVFKAIKKSCRMFSQKWMQIVESYDIFSSWFSFSFMGEDFKSKCKLWFSCCHCTLMKARKVEIHRWNLCNR